MSKLLALKEVQDRLGVSESTLFRMLKRKEITGFKVGRVWKFEEKDIEEYIKRQREKAAAEARAEEPSAGDRSF